MIIDKFGPKIGCPLVIAIAGLVVDMARGKVLTARGSAGYSPS